MLSCSLFVGPTVDGIDRIWVRREHVAGAFRLDEFSDLMATVRDISLDGASRSLRLVVTVYRTNQRIGRDRSPDAGDQQRKNSALFGSPDGVPSPGLGDLDGAEDTELHR